MVNLTAIKGIDGVPEPKKKPERVYVGAYFYWDFRRNWQPLVDLAKANRLRFDADLKKWKVPGPAVQYDIIRRLLALGEDAKNINVYDFEDETLIPVSYWQRQLKEYEGEIQQRAQEQTYTLATASHQSKAELVIDSEGVRVKMALKPSGKPKKFEDYLLWGLAKIGCKAQLRPDGCLWFTENVPFAVDYIVNNMDVKVVGIPRLLPSAFITDYFTDDQVFPHQKTGISFLNSRSRAILADDMGLGKSMQAILAAEQVKADGEASSLLIVCPVTLASNWRRELKMWDSSYKHVEIWPYSQLHKITEFPKRCVVIVDESHYVKHASSQRTQTLCKLVMDNEANISRLWFLSGTPVTKDNGDLWATAFMMKHNLAEEFSPIRLAAQKGENNAIVSGALKTHMLMRKKGDCLNLPEKIRQTIDVDTGLTEDREILRRGSSKAIMEHLMKIKRMSAEVKAVETIAFITPLVESGQKVVVFSEHTAAIEKIHAAFQEQAVLLNGQTKPGERDVLVQRFQKDEECMVFCGQTQAAGVGITLTASTIVVFNDLTWLPSSISQAEDRCFAAGTKVLTPRGYIPIEDISIGDTVVGKSGKHCRVVDAWSSHNMDTLLVSITGNDDVYCTPNHKFLAADGQWVEARNLKKGMILARPECNGAKFLGFNNIWKINSKFKNSYGVEQTNGKLKHLPDLIECTDDFLFLCGYFIGDGFAMVKDGSGNFISLAGNQGKKMPALERCHKELSKLGLRMNERKGKVGIERRYFSKELATMFLDLFGHTAKNKRIPEPMLEMSAEQSRCLLDGLLASDGYIRMDYAEYVTVSDVLAANVVQLAMRCGLNPSIRKQTCGAHVVGMFLGKQRNTAKMPGKVRSVEPSGKRTVYDITVEGDESFVVGTTVVHNCHRIGQTGTVNVYYIVDPKLIIDSIILRILGNRSEEIASFESAEATVLAEVRAWAEANA